MSAIHILLERLGYGEPLHAGRLTMIQLLDAGAMECPGYMLLDAAEAEGLATVSEVSESGSVPELLLTNNGERPLFLLDGEEVVGAKQNRIINLSLLVPGLTIQRVPVSCVEAGRWNAVSAHFSRSDRAFFSRGRARKARDVTESLAAAGQRRTDQGAVWDDVSDVMARFSVASETSAVADVYADRGDSLDALLESLSAAEGAVGAVFLIDGEAVGMELFDATATWASLMPKILRSYGLDAVGASTSALVEDAGVDHVGATAFLASVRDAEAQAFPADGLGEDLRFIDAAVTGGALHAEGRIVHLCAFAAPDAVVGR